jgi:predicted esterase YcpF (UPF0227 family)
MPRLLYFHGFASSPASAKIGLLRARIEPEITLEAPDLNAPSFERLEFAAVVARALACARAHPPDALAGSSLGALVALAVAREVTGVPLVLVAPALGFGERWTGKLPPAGEPIIVHNHARNAETPIHRAFFEEMARVDVDRQPPAAPVTVIMGTADESVPYARVAEVWQGWEGRLAAGSRFVTVEGGDHGLVAHVDLIETAIREAVNRTYNRPHAGHRLP